jgi:hypothetical protein
MVSVKNREKYLLSGIIFKKNKPQVATFNSQGYRETFLFRKASFDYTNPAQIEK